MLKDENQRKPNYIEFTVYFVSGNSHRKTIEDPGPEPDSLGREWLEWFVMWSIEKNLAAGAFVGLHFVLSGVSLASIERLHVLVL